MPMPIEIQQTELSGVLEIHTGLIRDDRGFFAEIWSSGELGRHGFHETFLQDNLSLSRKGTLRGLHYQILPFGMGKLVRALSGRIFDVAVDLRRGSPTFGHWLGRELDAKGQLALWVPVGFAHGFLALEDDSLVLYKCTALHTPQAERALNYADPTVGIRWPVEPTVIAPKDAAAPRLEAAQINFEF